MTTPTRSYRKILRLASGGMGTVHVGVASGALGFRQLVALKELHSHLLVEPGMRERLIEEARLASKLYHPNIVDVRDVDVAGDTVTLVMPYVEGAPLAHLLGRARETGKPLPPGVALRIVLDAAAGLAAAHEVRDETGVPLGIVHRDVSPENLLIGADGVTRVADFGIAKYQDVDRPETTVGTFKGKVAYAAPEGFRGETPDARYDVFSLAVVLWEALTMERLFRGESDLETLERVQRHRAPRVSQRKATLASLDAVIDKALEKSKKSRQASMREFQSELEAAAGSLVASHREVGDFLMDVVGFQIEQRRAAIAASLRAEPGTAPEPTVTASVPATAETAHLPLRQTPRWAYAAGGAILAILALVAFVRIRSTPNPAAAAAAAPTPTSTPSAVLPPAVEAPAPAPDPAPTSTSTSTPTPTPKRPRKPLTDPDDPPPPPPNPYLRKGR